MENNELQKLKADFEAWRITRVRGRIPEELWRRAAELAKEIGITKVQLELRLDFRRLKKRMGETKLATKQKFVKLPMPGGSKMGSCILKVESATGARMQAELESLEVAGLSQIIRDFSAC